jgi:hypothetical protein
MNHPDPLLMKEGTQGWSWTNHPEPLLMKEGVRGWSVVEVISYTFLNL